MNDKKAQAICTQSPILKSFDRREEAWGRGWKQKEDGEGGTQNTSLNIHMQISRWKLGDLSAYQIITLWLTALPERGMGKNLGK